MNTGTALVGCKTCGKTYPHPRAKGDRSTSTLNKHIKQHLKRKAETEARKACGQSQLTDFVHPGQGYVGLTTAEVERLLLQTAVACNWSFNQFDNKIFRKFFEKAFPGHRCPGRRKVKTILTRVAAEARKDIIDRFAANDSNISLALDCWTSSNGYEFMGTSSARCSMTVCRFGATRLLVRLHPRRCSLIEGRNSPCHVAVMLQHSFCVLG
jgi:hypothetical protein